MGGKGPIVERMAYLKEISKIMFLVLSAVKKFLLQSSTD